MDAYEILFTQTSGGKALMNGNYGNCLSDLYKLAR